MGCRFSQSTCLSSGEGGQWRARAVSEVLPILTAMILLKISLSTRTKRTCLREKWAGLGPAEKAVDVAMAKGYDDDENYN